MGSPKRASGASDVTGFGGTGEQQPFENKTFPIWLLNSKYLLPSVKALPKVLLLKQTRTYSVLMAGVVCCRIGLLRGGGSI